MTEASDRLLTLVQSYFRDHLERVRGASPHTLRGYADALRLFFGFLAERTRRPVSRLRLDDIRADAVVAFLAHLENVRGNSVSTRNGRLAALHSFVEHLVRHDVRRAEQYRRILALPMKRALIRPPAYLEPNQVRAILAETDRRTFIGARDYALLLFLYNTGARVSEALAVRSGDLHLCRPYQVRLVGKGRKERLCPLWPETVKALRRIAPSTPNERVFRTSRGAPLGRDGVADAIVKYRNLAARRVPALGRCRITPHVLRHSTACALLQAGVDVALIRDYLGHASITTTSRYLATNLDAKRAVLERFWQSAHLTKRPSTPWRASPKLLAFLSSL
jgi:site-specific recombinase XerD